MSGSDWINSKAKSGPAPKPTAAPSPSKGSGGASWVTGGAAAPDTGAPKKKSLLGQFKSIVQAVPSGIVGLAKQGGTQIKNEVKFQGPLAPVTLVAAPPLALVKHVVAPPKPRPGETTTAMNNRMFPVAQQAVESFKRTGGDIVHPTHFARASGQGTIVSKVLEDAANASLVLGPLAKGAGAIADRTAAAAAAEGTADATARATAARIAAKTLHGAAVGTEAIASAPIKPYQLATTGIEAGPVLSRLPAVAAGDKVGLLPLAARGANRLAESEGVAGQVARAAKLDPQSRALRRDVLNPAAEEHGAVVGRQVKLGEQVEGKLRGPVEEQAMFLVGEGQAPALAKLRAELPDRFDEFVAAHFGDTVSPQAAHLAADIAETPATPAVFEPHSSSLPRSTPMSRVREALATGHTGTGGRVERSAEYLAGGGLASRAPGRQWEAGFAPNPAAIDAATQKAMADLPKARERAATLRERATGAGTALDQARADMGAQLDERAQSEGTRRLEQRRATLTGAVSRQEDRAVASADRLTSLQDLAEAAKTAPPAAGPRPALIDARATRLAKVLDAAAKSRQRLGAARAAVAAGEDRLATTAERSVPKDFAELVAKDRASVGKTYRAAAAKRAEDVRADMARFFDDGPLAKVDLKATSADWVRNLAPSVRAALQKGLGVTDASLGGLSPDEFMHNARRVNAALAGMTDEQIADYIARQYDDFALLRKARFTAAAGVTPDMLRAAGISDDYLELLLGDATPSQIAGYLKEHHGVDAPASVADQQTRAMATAGGALVSAQAAGTEAFTGGGARPAGLAGKHFDALRAGTRVDEAVTRVPQARSKLGSLFERQGEGVGRAAERAAQGGRLARLESRRLANLRAQTERLPERADAVHVNPTYGQGKRLGALETRARVLENTARSAEARAGRLTENVKVQAASAADSIAAAPARLRPMLELNRRVVHELRSQGLPDAAGRVDAAVAEIPTTLKALEAAGVDVDHFIHVQAGDKPVRAGVTNSDARLPQVRKARSEKFRGENLRFDRTVRAQTQGEIDEARAVIARVTAERIAKMPFAAKLGEGPLEGVGTAAEAAAARYVPWNPATVFEKGRVGRSEEQAVARGFEGHTVFVPEHIFDGFRSYFNDPMVEKILRKTYDPAIHSIKIGQLALSPGWQVGNLAGNAAMATLGAGVDPVTLGRSIIEVVRKYRASGPKGQRSFEDVVPRRLLTAGPTHSEFEYLRGPQDRALPKVRAAVTDKLGESKVGRATLAAGGVPGKVVKASFALNGFVDDIGRSAVFLAKKGQGLSDEAAVRSALGAMGDFSRMTPFEKRVVRRVIPYYAWSRHITQLAFRLPIEHPLRVAWTLHLADEYADPTTRDLPGSLAGSVRIGDKLLEPSRFFPFGDAGRILEPSGVEQQVSPIIKVPLQARSGINLNTGKPFSRPPGTGRHDEFGADLPTAPSVAKQVGDLFPQKRLLDAATGRDKVARYGTGDKVLTKNGTIPTGKTGGLGALRFLGVPVSDAKQAQAMAARVAAKQQANAKAKASYDKKKKAKR